MLIEFGDGCEPMAVGRHKVRTWLHCILREAGELPDQRAAELQQWLTDRGCDPLAPSVLVSRDDKGVYRVHVAGSRVEVELSELPVWLQRPEPESRAAAAPEVKPGGRRGSSRAAG